MSNLLINTNKIKDLIDLKFDNWQHPSSTNCYAYALGLDVPYPQISNHAYRVGCFSEDELKNMGVDVYSLNIEDALIYDMHTLGISMEKVDPDYRINLSEINNSFLIALCNGATDFHFLRKNNFDNLWYHKKGYLDFPRFTDDDGMVITNPKDAFFIYYNYVKTYKLDLGPKR